MLNKYEYAYVGKGYTLPEGFTWKTVHETRAKWDTPDYMVPLVVAGGVCTAWGVPIELGCSKADGDSGAFDQMDPYEYAEGVLQIATRDLPVDDRQATKQAFEALRLSIDYNTGLSADTHSMERTLTPSGGCDLQHWFFMMVATAPEEAGHVSSSFIGDIGSLFFERQYGFGPDYWPCFWLLPNGKHINVLYANHCFLGYTMGHQEWELEQAGWIKVSISPDYAYALNKPTAAQRSVLKKLGYTFDLGTRDGNTLRRFSKYPED